MQPKSIAEVLLKVWSVTMAVEAVVGIPSLLAQLAPGSTASTDSDTQRFFGIWSSAHVALTIVAAALVFAFARRLAERISPVDATTAPTGVNGLQEVAFVTLGAYFAVHGLRQTTEQLCHLALAGRAITEIARLVRETSPEALAGSVAQTLLGAALLLKSKRLAGFVASRPQATEEPPPDIEDDRR